MRFLWLIVVFSLQTADLVIANNEAFYTNPTKSSWTSFDKPLKTGYPKVEKIPDEEFAVQPIDTSLEGISIYNSKNVKFIPRNLESFPELIALNLFNCSIRTVDDRHFKKLFKLRALHIQYNGIDFVSSDAFKDLVSLERLYLSHNEIQSLSAKIFTSQRNLRELYLTGNQISFLHPKLFNSLVNINVIHLNKNSIYSLDENIFESLSYLKNASLAENNLMEIPEELFATNSALEYAWFNPNKIKFVKSETFERLKNLKLVNLKDNECIDKFYWSSAFEDMKKDLKQKCTSDEARLEEKNKNLEMQIAVLAEAQSMVVQELQKLRLEMAGLKNEIEAVNQTAQGVAIVF